MEQLKQINKNISDNEILERILTGEKYLFEQIIRKYNQRLFRIGRTFLRDENEVEDILQEAYIKAYENLASFKHLSSFSTWLTRILINVALSRKTYYSKTHSTDFQSQANPESDLIKNIEVKEMKTPEQYTINNELKNHLERSIDNLPEKYKVVYMMREIENMSISETSECLNISETNVKVRLNRAKEMLRLSLSNIYENAEIFQFLGERCDRIVDKVMNKLYHMK